jgi:hypothetical protein
MIKQYTQSNKWTCSGKCIGAVKPVTWHLDLRLSRVNIVSMAHVSAFQVNSQKVKVSGG